jgi:hypothetical protein
MKSFVHVKEDDMTRHKRMENMGDSCRAMEGKPEGKRRLGRRILCGSTWYNIKMELI